MATRACVKWFRTDGHLAESYGVAAITGYATLMVLAPNAAETAHLATWDKSADPAASSAQPRRGSRAARLQGHIGAHPCDLGLIGVADLLHQNLPRPCADIARGDAHRGQGWK